MLQRPTAIGLFLCEQVIIQEGTRNATLVNMLRQVQSVTFPTPPVSLVAFAALTDGLGELSMRLVISRLDTLDVVQSYAWRQRFRDPLRPSRTILRLRDLVFPDPVRYEFSLLAEGECVAQCDLLVGERENTQ